MTEKFNVSFGKKGPRALREYKDLLLHNDHERDGVKHFWHILKVIDTSHEHFKFLSCRFSWNFVLKITRDVFSDFIYSIYSTSRSKVLQNIAGQIKINWAFG